jgi:hypothetical protein
MEDFPSNSHRIKPVLKDEEPPKKVEKVIEGEVLRRKKPLSKRLAENFVGGDSKTVGSYILFDVLLPAAKDMMADATSLGVERLLFGEARSTSRRTGLRPGQSNSSYISYNRYPPTNATSYGHREDPRGPTPSRRARATHNFDEIILATRVEAEEVVDRLFDLVSRYESATVADLYELVGIAVNYTDNKWGWTDLRGAGVARVRNGYLLDLPRPESLD